MKIKNLLSISVVVLSFQVALLLAPAAQASKELICAGSGTWTLVAGSTIEPGVPISVEKVTADEFIAMMWHEYDMDGILEGKWFGVRQRIVLEYDTGKFEGEEEQAYLSGTVYCMADDAYYNAYLEIEDEWTANLATGCLEGSVEILGGNVGVMENITGTGTYSGNCGWTGVGPYELKIYLDVD